MTPAAAGVGLEVQIHHLILFAQIVAVAAVLLGFQHMLVSGEAAQGVQNSKHTGHHAERNAVLVHRGILYAADTGYQRSVKLSNRQHIVHLFLGEPVESAHAGGNADSTEGAAAVSVLIVIHQCRTHTHGGFIGNQ